MSTLRVHAATALFLVATLAGAPALASAGQETCVRFQSMQGPGTPGPIVEVGSTYVVGVSTATAQYLIVVTPGMCTPETASGTPGGQFISVRDDMTRSHSVPLP